MKRDAQAHEGWLREEWFAFAFGDEIAQTDDHVIVEATRTSALPKANRHSLSLFLGTQIGATRTSAYPSPQSKQTESWFAPGASIFRKQTISIY